MTKRTSAIVLSAIALAACGGGEGSAPDAFETIDAPAGDAAPDLCDFHETDDAGNDTTPEVTALDVGTAGLHLCGQIDARTPDGGVVDVDQYRVHVPQTGSYVVRLKAAGAGDLSLVQFFFLEDGHAGRFVGTHGVFVAPLAVGEATLTIAAFAPSAPGAPVPYTMTIAPDDIDARCMTLSGNPSYSETYDGATSADNDVVTIMDTTTFAIGQTPDTPTVDAPEPTNLVVAPALSVKLAGDAGVDAEATGYGDDYRDRDTYLIATGAETDELSIRLDFADDTGSSTDDADLDVFLLDVPPDATAAPEPVTVSNAAALAGPEFATTAVLPSTTYWLTVGSFAGLTGDKPYTVTICGASFTP